MKLKSAILLCAAIAVSSTVYAQDGQNVNSGQFALGGSVATGGNVGIEAVYYGDWAELGLGLSGQYDNASQQTKTITPVVFAGLRTQLADNTFFAYGVNGSDTFGRDSGDHIDANYHVGPYVSIEQQIVKHVLLSAWVNPYNYEYEKKGGVSTTTNRFFGSGGLTLSYLF